MPIALTGLTETTTPSKTGGNEKEGNFVVLFFCVQQTNKELLLFAVIMIVNYAREKATELSYYFFRFALNNLFFVFWCKIALFISYRSPSVTDV